MQLNIRIVRPIEIAVMDLLAQAVIATLANRLNETLVFSLRLTMKVSSCFAGVSSCFARLAEMAEKVNPRLFVTPPPVVPVAVEVDATAVLNTVGAILEEAQAPGAEAAAGVVGDVASRSVIVNGLELQLDDGWPLEHQLGEIMIELDTTNVKTIYLPTTRLEKFHGIVPRVFSPCEVTGGTISAQYLSSGEARFQPFTGQRKCSYTIEGRNVMRQLP